MKFRKLLTCVMSLFLVLFISTIAGATYRAHLVVGELVVEKSARIAGLLQAAANTTGDVWYVNSATGIDGVGQSGQSAETPFDTLDYAIGRCTANNGDFIIVMPGHAETIAAADGWDADVAGITIVGLGDGTDMPEFTFSATASTVAIGAANVSIYNLRFLAGISAVVAGVMVEAAGDNFLMSDCVFPEPTTSTFEFIDAIDLAALADGVTIQHNTYFNADATGGAHFIEAGNGVNTNLQILNNYIYGEFSVAAIWSDTIDLEVLIKDNYIRQMTSGQHAVEFTTTALGAMIDNTIVADTYLNTIDPGSLSLSGNRISVGVDSASVAFPQFEDGALRSCVKTDGASLTGDDDLFVIAGGPIKNVKIIGVVTTALVGAANGDLQIDVTEPAATVDLNAAPVAIDNDAAGTMYMNIDSTSIFTPITNGASIIDDVAAPEAYFNLPVGTVIFRSSAAQTGVIEWTMTYEAGPGVTVTAAP